MQQIYEKSGPQTMTIFSSTNSPKKWTTVPKFMLTANFQHHSKTFVMFQLQRSWLNSNSVFRDLVGEIASFNKELMEMKNTIQIPNYLKTYHLYKNLHEQLQTLTSIASSIKQAKQQLDQIKKNFHREKAKLKESSQPKLLPGIPSINSSAIDPEQEQNLRKTVRQMQTRREFEVHALMPRTYYAQNLPYKDRTFDYRNQQESLDFSQTVSVFSESTPYESRLLQHHPSVESSGKSKSVSNLASTAWTSQVHNYSNFLNKNSKLQNSPKVKPFSQVFSSGQKNQTNRIRSKSVTDFQFVPKIPTKFNKHSDKILDTLITKDKIQKIICEPDPNLIKKLLSKDLEKPLEIHNIKSSRVSFMLKPQKSQLIDRKQFISVKSELGKFKKSQNRLRTDLNRKLQLKKYISNHVLQLNTQVSKDAKFSSLKEQVGKKLINLPKKEINFSHNQKPLNESAYAAAYGSSKLKVITQQIFADPAELKKKQFEQTLRKQSIKSSMSSYMKYINHLPQTNPQDVQNNSQLGKTVSSNFSSHFGTTRKSFISQSEKKFQSLTTFRTASLQKNFGPHNGLTVIKTLNKHSIQRNNQEILDEVVKLKLRIAENENQNNLNAVMKNKLLFKGLQLHHAPQDTDYQVIQPKLFSNPFFVAPKASKKTKKKKKK